jgi:hypothetical protein
VEKSAFNSLSAILEFSLHPLKIAEPGAIGIGGEHAGGDEVRGDTLGAGCIFHNLHSFQR